MLPMIAGDMSISKIRSLLYRSARLLGDVNAVRRGKILQRVKNRIIGKLASRFLRRFMR
jgi:hypothetical protein